MKTNFYYKAASIFIVILMNINYVMAQSVEQKSHLINDQTVSFDAVVKNNKIVLDWVSKNDKNINYVEIERSIDGKNYKQIGLVLAGENDDKDINYTFPDNVSSVSKNVIYYRLKNVNNGGDFTYSEVIKVNNIKG